MNIASRFDAQVNFAHRAADIASLLSPWWRFRVWARLAGPGAYVNYADDSERPTKVWPHNAVMDLRPGDWMERYAHEAGRYYQDDLIQALLQMVKPGSTFVDIGANLGFVTLTASKLVGPQGRVISVEANADLVSRLTKTLTRNAITNVQLHNVALGSATGEVVLKAEGHHGTSHIDFDGGGGRTVPLRRGDDVVGEPEGPVVVKVDVEGAELMVLQGLPRLLARTDVTWLVEICEGHLSRFDATPEAIFDLMSAAGYSVRLPCLSPFSDRLQLKPLDPHRRRPLYDAVFIRE